MKRKMGSVYVIGVLIPLVVGAFSALLSMKGMQRYALEVEKPSLSPAQWLFPVAWTILYILMGIGSARVWSSPKSTVRSKGLNLYTAQLIVNFFWSLLFFNGRAYGLSVIWLVLLLLLAVWMVSQFRKVDPFAAWIQVPYLIWLIFALYLNIGVWIIN